MTTTTKRLVCCHCGNKDKPDDPVRTNYPERSRNGVAHCVNRSLCWKRYDLANSLPVIK